MSALPVPWGVLHCGSYTCLWLNPHQILVLACNVSVSVAFTLGATAEWLMSEICVLYWVARQLFGFSIESLSYITVGDYWNTSQFHFRQSQFTPSSNVETSNVEQLTVVRDSIKLLQWHSASSSHSLDLKHWVWTRIHKRVIDRPMHAAHKHAKCRLKSLIPLITMHTTISAPNQFPIQHSPIANW